MNDQMSPLSALVYTMSGGTAQCPLSEVTQKTFAHTEFFSA
jgi:hypothetical protein